MTELSSAAKSVLDAIESRIDRGAALAAALRAAAYLVAPTGEPSPGANYAAGARNEGLAIGLRILAIADELDNVKYGTYRSDLSDKPK